MRTIGAAAAYRGMQQQSSIIITDHLIISLCVYIAANGDADRPRYKVAEQRPVAHAAYVRKPDSVRLSALFRRHCSTRAVIRPLFGKQHGSTENSSVLVSNDVCLYVVRDRTVWRPLRRRYFMRSHT